MDNSFNSGKKKISLIVILLMTLFLCIESMVGITYALFTNGDDGKIGVNITSGECKINIVDRDENSLIGDVLDFITTNRNEKIYFEPGATFYTEGFKVKNVGSIPVNFRVFISEDEENNRYEFQEAFDLFITKDITNLENAEKLTEFTGRLEIEQSSEFYYLVVRMKDTADNKFQNKNYTGIGVTVYAVQGNVNIGA